MKRPDEETAEELTQAAQQRAEATEAEVARWREELARLKAGEIRHPPA